MSYKVEELLALRDSVSESAVSIEKFADEDVIKEHVLRSSASATLAAASSNKSLRSAATPALAPSAPVKKPSPSPSIKRGKAERLLKEHGSPPGIRVTAGGRIVPSDLPPVLSNRFVNSALKPPALRGIPITNTMSAEPRVDANSVARLEVVGTQPVLYVGDRAYALPALETATPTTPSLPSGVLDVASKPADTLSSLHGLSTRSSFASAPSLRVASPAPLAEVDVDKLKSQQALKKQELRTVEQTEVLQASQQTDAWRATMIEKKRNLIIELDALRKQITALEAADNKKAAPIPSNGFSSMLGPGPGPMPPASFAPHFQPPVPSPMYGYGGASLYPPMMMFQPPSPYAGYPNIPSAEPVPSVPVPTQATQSPGSSSRRSHAIQIKAPPGGNKKQMASALDPKSPTYEPLVQETAKSQNIPPTTSPVKRSPWSTNSGCKTEQHERQGLSHKPSLSSIDTTDFFPTNTHEHSSTRVAPKAPESKPMTSETSAVPSTPEKSWPASPWNEEKSSRSSHRVVPKLPAWPEAFGKQSSTGSLRQNATVQNSVHERIPLQSAEPSKSAFTSSSTSSHQANGQRFSTDDTWPLVNSKPINHMPSTYQEGFQAGYDHVGIPDDPEVLKGYIQGLIQFLADESKKGLNGSLRGLVANSQPHDSAISMTYDRVDGPVGSQENSRASKLHSAMGIRKDSACGPPDPSSSYLTAIGSAKEQQIRNMSPQVYMNSSATAEKMSPAFHMTMSENVPGKNVSENGTLGRAEGAPMLGSMYRQFSGKQITNRAYGAAAPVQQFSRKSSEQSMKGVHGDVPPFARPMANQRLSGLDGAMDDLSELLVDTHIHGQQYQQVAAPSSVTDDRRYGAAPHAADAPRHTHNDQRSAGASSGDVSCFRPSSSKGKQKAMTSPMKSGPSEQSEVTSSASPKKSGEHSPAKAKLEQVTNKFRRRKDDVRNMSPEQRRERANKWRKRFRQLREEEEKSVREHRRNQGPQGDER